MRIQIIRTDGREEHVTGPFREIAKLIGAKVLDTVNLGGGRIMVVDDLGYETQPEQRGNVTHLVPVRARKPVNEKATALYHEVCVQGTTHQIVGDVAVILDEEVD